jgi:dihydrofolate reductase
MGSATYEWMLRNAGKMIAETGSAWPYTQPTWVFSRRPQSPVEGADIRFVKDDVRQVHAEMRAGLLDEIIVQIGSVTLGKGKPLFPRRVLSPSLRLVSVRQMGSGMAELRYEVHRGDTGSAP